jgi:hypothetical protein
MGKYIKSMLIIGENHLSLILRAASISDLPPKNEFTPLDYRADCSHQSPIRDVPHV